MMNYFTIMVMFWDVWFYKIQNLLLYKNINIFKQTRKDY